MDNETSTTEPLSERLCVILGHEYGHLRTRVETAMTVSTNHLDDPIVWALGHLEFVYDSDGDGHIQVTEIATTRLAIIDAADVEDNLLEIHEICDADSSDLGEVASRMCLLADDGWLAEGVANRLIILDSVEVVDAFRGMGAAQVAAAATLRAVHAHSTDTLTAAIAGARVGDSDGGGDERATITAAAAAVLSRVGLARYSTDGGDVYVGDPCYAAFGDALDRCLARG